VIDVMNLMNFCDTAQFGLDLIDKMNDNDNYSSDTGSGYSSDDSDSGRQKWRRMAHMAALTVSGIVACTMGSHYDKQGYHTSALSGADWVRELLDGHPERIRSELGVHNHVFNAIVDELKLAGLTNSRYIFLEEQVGIFLYTCVTGLSLRHVGERFQHSGETISTLSRFIDYLNIC
jgi:hypothetical protein